MYMYALLITCIIHCECKMEPFIVQGEMGSIQSFPHSAFLFIKADDEFFICGGSVINQDFVLTAAHCIEFEKVLATVFVGSERKKGGRMTNSRKVLIHERYDHFQVKNDIGLVRLRTRLKLGVNVKRVALRNVTRFNKEATVAGWGTVDEISKTGTNFLKYAKQNVLSREKCLDILKSYMPFNTFCTEPSPSNIGYAAAGDSGSALIMDGYIQVGLVSFKYPTIRTDVGVYTDVSRYYSWIQDTAIQLMCFNGKDTKKDEKKNYNDNFF